MAFREERFDFADADLVVSHLLDANEHHLYERDEPVELYAALGKKALPHITALIQTAPIDAKMSSKTPEARDMVYDDLLLVDMRKVPSQYSRETNRMVRMFGNMPMAAEALFLLVHSLSYNPQTRHGFKGLRLGERVEYGTASLEPVVTRRFAGVSQATQPHHFEIQITPSGDIEIDALENAQGTHIYEGKAITDRLRWTDRRLRAQERMHHGFLRRLLSKS